MDETDLRHIEDLEHKRDEKICAWFRWLILLAAGALAILVSLTNNSIGPAATVFIKVAWASLGAGIMFGSFALYVEIWMARKLVKRMVEEMQKDERGLVTVNAPRILLLCEPLYISLIVSVVATVAFAFAR